MHGSNWLPSYLNLATLVGSQCNFEVSFNHFANVFHLLQVGLVDVSILLALVPNIFQHNQSVHAPFVEVLVE